MKHRTTELILELSSMLKPYFSYNNQRDVEATIYKWFQQKF